MEPVFATPTEINPVGCFRAATKTKPIRAKPLNAILVDQSVVAQFLVATLEGRQSIRPGALVCIGEGKEIWQQPPNKLLAKYTVTDVDADGWMVCLPKEGNRAWAKQVTEQGNFYIKAQWGETQPDGTKRQYGESGDFILRSETDKEDVWIVRQSLFVSTYELLEETKKFV